MFHALASETGSEMSKQSSPDYEGFKMFAKLLGKATLCPSGLLIWEDVGHGGPRWRDPPETESTQGSNLKR